MKTQNVHPRKFWRRDRRCSLHNLKDGVGVMGYRFEMLLTVMHEGLRAWDHERAETHFSRWHVRAEASSEERRTSGRRSDASRPLRRPSHLQGPSMVGQRVRIHLVPFVLYVLLMYENTVRYTVRGGARLYLSHQRSLRGRA